MQCKIRETELWSPPLILNDCIYFFNSFPVNLTMHPIKIYIHIYHFRSPISDTSSIWKNNSREKGILVQWDTLRQPWFVNGRLATLFLREISHLCLDFATSILHESIVPLLSFYLVMLGDHCKMELCCIKSQLYN